MAKRLRTDTVRKILQYHRAGYSVSEIAAAFGNIHRVTVSRIVNGKTHKRVRADGRLKPLVPVELPEQLPHLPDGSPGIQAQKLVDDHAAFMAQTRSMARGISGAPPSIQEFEQIAKMAGFPSAQKALDALFSSATTSLRTMGADERRRAYRALEAYVRLNPRRRPPQLIRPT